MPHAVGMIILQAAKKRGSERNKGNADEEMGDSQHKRMMSEDRKPMKNKMMDKDDEDHGMTLRLRAAEKKKKQKQMARTKRDQEKEGY